MRDFGHGPHLMPARDDSGSGKFSSGCALAFLFAKHSRRQQTHLEVGTQS